MSTPSACCCESPVTVTVAVPGPEGDGGTLPIPTTADFIIPAVGSQVAVAVESSSGFRIAKNVFVYGSNFQVFANPVSGTSVTLTFLGFPGDGAVGSTVPSGSLIGAGVGNLTASQILDAGALTTIAAISQLTNNSTGSAAATTLAAGLGVSTIVVPVTIIAGTAAADYLTNYTPGYRFQILGFSWVTAVAVAGASGSRVFNMEIGTTDVGTVAATCTVTTAANATVGSVTNSTTVTGANLGTSIDTISIEVASGGTTITGGSGAFLIRIQNLDTADAAASINGKLNALLTALS
jgi:hypothetical protein